ncbi:MAG: BrnA antitoxin family protein [Sphingomonas sp.]
MRRFAQDAFQEPASLRLGREIVVKFHESGPCSQTRMNTALRKAAGLG